MAFGWGISLLIMLIWAGYFIWTVRSSHSLRLLSLIPLAGVLDVVGIYLAVIWGHAVVIGYRCNGVAWAVLPFFTLLFALHYPTVHQITRHRWVVPLLTLPVLITVVITDPSVCSNFQERPFLALLVLWMAPYFLFAYFLLVRSIRRMRLPIIRHQVFYLALGLILITGNHMVIDIILPIFGYDNLWRNNHIIITLTCILLAWGFLRHDIFRWQVQGENRNIDLQIESMTDGARVLAHIMKNHLSVIEYLATQAEEGRTESIPDIRATCQNVCRRLDEVGEMPPVDSKPDEVISIKEFIDEICTIEVRDNQRIIKNMASSLPYIKGSWEQLKLAFRHLILNASESMPEGGEISIEAQQEGDYIVVRIIDQGVGITKERLKNIFRPFNTSKSLYQSWGLGLSFAHQVFAAHRGGLIVESKPGKETVFIGFLPAHPGRKENGLIALISKVFNLRRMNKNA